MLEEKRYCDDKGREGVVSRRKWPKGRSWEGHAQEKLGELAQEKRGRKRGGNFQEMGSSSRKEVAEQEYNSFKRKDNAKEVAFWSQPPNPQDKVSHHCAPAVEAGRPWSINRESATKSRSLGREGDKETRGPGVATPVPASQSNCTTEAAVHLFVDWSTTMMPLPDPHLAFPWCFSVPEWKSWRLKHECTRWRGTSRLSGYVKTIVEESLEVKLPTIDRWKSRGGRVKEDKKRREKIREEKEWEERRCRYAKR